MLWVSLVIFAVFVSYIELSEIDSSGFGDMLLDSRHVFRHNKHLGF